MRRRWGSSSSSTTTKLSASFPARLVRDRWTMVVVSFFILSTSGATYMFGLYSGAIKKAMAYDQETLDTLGFFKDLGANVGLVSGLLSELVPPWAIIAVGSAMNLLGYLMVWLAVTGRLSRPPPWQMYAYLCLGANSQTFANTGVVVTCVKNFPTSRGIVIGLLKGFVGLSGAILTQIYHALYAQDATSLLLLIAWLPSLVSLLLMPFVRLLPSHPRRPAAADRRMLYSFLAMALLLAGFLMVVIVVENQISLSVGAYRGMAAITVLIILLNLGFVVRDVRERAGEEEPNDEVAAEAAQPSRCDGGQAPPSLSKWPKRGDDFTIPQALMSLDMWLLFIATTCGVGAALTAIDNLGQIGDALGYPKVSISTFVSLVSIWNFLGRVVAGCASEALLQRHKVPRPLMMSAVLGVASAAHLLIAFGLPGSLYAASVIIGFCFGAQWPVLFAVISELFGLKYYATLFNCGAVASPLGSYLLSVRVAGYLYDKEARKEHSHPHVIALSAPSPSPSPALTSELSCSGVHCFQTTFIIMAAVSLFGCLVSGYLAFRTRHFYKQDIYEKFKQPPLPPPPRQVN